MSVWSFRGGEVSCWPTDLPLTLYPMIQTSWLRITVSYFKELQKNCWKLLYFQKLFDFYKVHTMWKNNCIVNITSLNFTLRRKTHFPILLIVYSVIVSDGRQPYKSKQVSSLNVTQSVPLVGWRITKLGRKINLLSLMYQS